MIEDIKKTITKRIVASALIGQLFIQKRLIDLVQLIVYCDTKVIDLLCAIHYIRTLYFRKTQFYKSYVEFTQAYLEFISKQRLSLPSLNMNAISLSLKYAMCFALTVTLFVYPTKIRAEEAISGNGTEEIAEEITEGSTEENVVEEEPQENDANAEQESNETDNGMMLTTVDYTKVNGTDKYEISYAEDGKPIMAYSKLGDIDNPEFGEVAPPARNIYGWYEDKDGGSWKQTTYRSYSIEEGDAPEDGFGFKIRETVKEKGKIEVDSKYSDWKYASTDTSNDTSNEIVPEFLITTKYSFVNNGKHVKIEYVVENLLGIDKTIDFAIYGDIKIGGQDKAPTKVSSQGIVMAENGFSGTGAQFNLISKNSGSFIGDSSKIWIGAYKYGDYKNNCFKDLAETVSKPEEYVTSDIDSAMTVSWMEKSIGADASQTFTVLVGIGNTSSTLPKLSIDSSEQKPLLYDGITLKIKASDEAKQSSTLMAKFGESPEYPIGTLGKLTDQNNEIKVTIDLPKNTSLKSGEQSLSLWLVNADGSLSTPVTWDTTIAFKKYVYAYHDENETQYAFYDYADFGENARYLDGSTFSRIGYELDKWSTEKNEQGTDYNLGDYIYSQPDSDGSTKIIDLYAKWKKVDAVLAVEQMIAALENPADKTLSSDWTKEEAAKEAFDKLKFSDDLRPIVDKVYRDKLDALLLKRIELKNGEAFSKVITKNDAPQTSVKGLESQVVPPISGKTTLELTVEKVDSSVDEAKIKEKLENKTKVGAFLDIKLEEITEQGINSNTRPLDTLPYPITMTFDIPANLQGNLNYYMIRVHGEEASILHDLDSNANTITIESDKFSTYALCYEEKTAVAPELPSSGGSSSIKKEDELTTGFITGSRHAIPSQSKLVIDQRRNGQPYREYRSQVKSWSTLYDLKLMNKENIVELKGEVLVSLDIPSNYSYDQLKLVEMRTDGTIKEINFAVKGNSVQFKTNHLGTFVLSDLLNHKGWEAEVTDWYYYNEKGEEHTGWVASSGSRWYYCEDGKMLVNEWKQDTNQKWYYFNENGVMERNADINFNGSIHHVNEHGSMTL